MRGVCAQRDRGARGRGLTKDGVAVNMYGRERCLSEWQAVSLTPKGGEADEYKRSGTFSVRGSRTGRNFPELETKITALLPRTRLFS